MGVYAQILYPNAVGFASNSMFGIDDITLRNEIQRIYNDFLVDIQHESGDRLLPQAVLPIWDMDLTVKEMTRLAGPGFEGSPSPTSRRSWACPISTPPTSPRCGPSANEMGVGDQLPHRQRRAAPELQDSDPAVQEARRQGSAVAGPNPDIYWESLRAPAPPGRSWPPSST